MRDHRQPVRPSASSESGPCRTPGSMAQRTNPLPWSITVDVTTGLFTHLHQLSVSNGLDGDTLADALLAFTADLRAAVPSYLGLQLTIVENNRPVTLTEIDPDRIATTSLRLPLAAVGPNFDPDSWITLYAAT